MAVTVGEGGDSFPSLKAVTTWYAYVVASPSSGSVRVDCSRPATLWIFSQVPFSDWRSTR